MTITIGDRIKAARNAAGLTQKELAEKFEVAEITIRQYESNKRVPRSVHIGKLAEILGVSKAYLMGWDNGFNESPESEPCNMDATRKWIVNKQTKRTLDANFDKLNAIGKYKVAEYTEDLTKIPEYQKKDENTHILVNAAHARTDIEVTEEMKKHDDDIMNDENL